MAEKPSMSVDDCAKMNQGHVKAHVRKTKKNPDGVKVKATCSGKKPAVKKAS